MFIIEKFKKEDSLGSILSGKVDVLGEFADKEQARVFFKETVDILRNNYAKEQKGFSEAKISENEVAFKKLYNTSRTHVKLREI